MFHLVKVITAQGGSAGGRILGVSDVLRVVFAKERTQRGLELAPMGRPYVSFSLLKGW